ncbi:MAG TPA: CoA-binding protein [Planctomycetota bacterium]|nr:CoA-binding protein [Planctomycetota bacterium]
MKSDDEIIDAFLGKKRLAVVGASDRREKWGNKIVRYLVERGHEVVPVNPGLDTVEGLRCYKTLEDIPRPESGPPVDGIDLVVNPSIGIGVARSAAALGIPIIFAQPGAESPVIEEYCRENGVDYVEACVLVEGRARSVKPGGR